MTEAVRSSGDSVENSNGPLARLIDELKYRTESGQEVSIGLVQEIAGARAAGPILLLPALIVMSPLSVIPGLPSIVGFNTILVAGQVALGRDRLWLPQWLTKRCIRAKHGQTLLRFLAPVGETVDKLIKPRAEATAGPLFRRVGALVCVLVGAIMPILELIPFTSTWAASIIVIYALAITVKDGFLALAWSGMVLGILLVVWTILF